MGPAITALVATRDRPGHLLRLLGELAEQTLPRGAFEVLVTDDGSTVPVEGLVPGAQADALSLTVVRGESAGPAAARNRALGRVSSPLLLFLNDDTRVASDLLAAHLEGHARTTRPTAIMGTFEWTPALAADPFHRAVEDRGLIGTRRMSPGVPLPPSCFWTGNLSVPTTVVERVGGFDAGFAEPKGEDVDLGHRLAREGVPLLFTRRAVGLHDHPHSLPEWWARAEMIGRALARLAEKHGDPGYVPGGAPALASPRRAAERVNAQAPLAERWRALIAELLATPDRPAPPTVPGLDEGTTAGAERGEVLGALVAAVTHFEIQRSFWAARRGGDPRCG